MKVYHVTDTKAAALIRRRGFRDSTGSYLTGEVHTGVWISNRPLDENEGTASASVTFETDIDGRLLRQYEWIEEGKPYREWLVPAAMLNARQRREIG